jgi:gliding motility-associated-like protein
MSRTAVVLWLLLFIAGDSKSQMSPYAPGPVTTGALTLNVTITNNASCAYNNGIFVATASGGTPPYTYTSNKLGLSNGSGIFSNVPPGACDVEVRDASGQTASTTVPMANNFIPPFITGQGLDPSGCGKTDGSVTLTPGEGLGPYQYSIDDGLTYQTSNVFPNLGTGFYNIWVKDANGCVSAPWSFLGGSYLDYQFYDIKPHYQVVLTPSCGLQLSAVPSGPVCGNNGTITFYAASGGIPPYTYSLDGINFAPNTVHGYTGLAPGQYTVFARDATGLTITIALDIPRNCPVTAVPAATSCGQGNGTITVTRANGAAPYTYSIDGTHFQSSAIFTGLAAGSYTVIARDLNGATGSVEVEVQAGCPFVNAVATNATCGQINGTITVLAGGAPGPYQYSLDGFHFQSVNTFTGLAPGPYTVTVNDASGFMGTAGATIGDKPAPVIGASVTAASCVNNNGSITVTPQGGLSPFQYSVSGGNSAGGFQDAGFFPGLDTGTKTISVKDANGCLVSQVADIPLTDDLTLDAGGNGTICEGTGMSLTASSNGTSFSWAPVSGLSDAALLNPLASPVATTIYTITAMNGLCRRTGPVTVSVNPAPAADPGPDKIICSGQSIQLHGAGGLHYAWSPDTYLDNAAIADPTVVQPSNSIGYTLQVTDGNGCRSLGADAVQITVTPPARVFAGNDTAVVVGQPLRLHAEDVNNSGFTKYQWSPADGLDNPLSQNPALAFTAVGEITYTITASTPEGCKGTGDISVKAYSVADIFVPNAFTPNGDGHNDLLRAIPAGIREFRSFAVYSRWGQQIFQTANPGKGWDGTINGRPQVAGTYIWTARGTDFNGNDIQRRGMVILIR